MNTLRMYTPDFARNLMKAYNAWCAKPAAERGDVRVRRSVDTKRTDRELFEAMPLGDPWLESSIHEVYFYLRESKHLSNLV